PPCTSVLDLPLIAGMWRRADTRRSSPTSIVNVHIFQFAHAVIRSTLTSAHKVNVTQMPMRLVAVITALGHGPTGCWYSQ
ncbi:MAG: hypothetical protein ACLP56_20400, partial [Candidatus Sulfotelmatobacter sp.]